MAWHGMALESHRCTRFISHRKDSGGGDTNLGYYARLSLTLPLARDSYPFAPSIPNSVYLLYLTYLPSYQSLPYSDLSIPILYIPSH